MKAKITDRLINSLDTPKKQYEIRDTDIKGFCLIIRLSGTMSFCYRYRNADGRAKCYTIGKYGSLTTTQAREMAKQLQYQAISGIDVQLSRQEQRQLSASDEIAILGNFLNQRYFPWSETNHKSARDTKRVLNRDFSFIHTKPMEDITQWEISKWMSEQAKTGLAAASINRRVASLKSVISKALEWQVIDKNPLAGMKKLREDRLGRVRFLSQIEETRLREALHLRQEQQRKNRLNHIDWQKIRHIPCLPEKINPYTDYLRPLVIVALNTGMRRGELFDLEWDCVDLKTRIITVAGSTAKSGHTRHIPMNDECFAVLVAWRNQTDSERLVFPSPATGNRFDNITNAWKGVIQKAKIANFRFHDLRHTFASNLAMHGTDLLTIKELLGHSSIDMTMKYAHLAPNHMAGAVAKLNQGGASQITEVC